MKKNNKPDVPYKEYLLSIIAVAIISGGSVYSISKQAHQNVTTFEQAYPNYSDLVKINETYQSITDNYAGDIKKEELIDGAISGMLQALDDPYSDYFSGQSADDLDSTITGSFEGIGAVMTIKDKKVVIAEPPIKDSPAAKAQLKAGDIILQVNDEKTEDKSLSEVVESIRGKANTEVKLKIERKTEVFSTVLKRASVMLETVTGEIDKTDKSVGVITISSFSEQTSKEFKDIIEELRKKGAKSFVFDVRQNPGGLLDQVTIMSSMLLKDGKTIVKFEDKNKKQTKIVASAEYDDGFKVNEPSVVLVDSGSASASEIFAAALSESGAIPLIGDKTFGKGTVQSVQNLSEDSDLKLTTSKWLTPKGTWINQKGIEPTIKIDYRDYENLRPIDINQNYQLNMTGKNLVNINNLLSVLKFDVDKTSNTFNTQTETAVKSFQSENKLEVTGVIDKETAQAIQNKVAQKMQKDDRALVRGIQELSKK